MLKEEFKRMR